MSLPQSRIDLDALRSRVDMHAIITADLGEPDRRRRWLCPYHDDRSPSLGITPDRMHWRCWSCGQRGDVLDWFQQRNGLGLAEAVRRLDPLALADRTMAKASAARPTPAPSRPETWRDAAWQSLVVEIVASAEAALWSPAGREALDWLRGRGLADHVIARYRSRVRPARLPDRSAADLGSSGDHDPLARSRRGL